MSTEYETILALIEQFKVDRSLFYQHCLNPQKIQGRCDILTCEFFDYISLVSPSISQDEMVVEGCHDWPNHSWDHCPRFMVYWHQLNRVGSYYVDWTIRQFDTKATVPAIYTEEELKKIWKKVWTAAEFASYEEERRNATYQR